MLEIIIPEVEHWDEEKEEFYTTYGTRGRTIQLEHSLISLSKWESKWKKPFLSNNNKTMEEIKDYVRCMTITKNVPKDAYDYIPTELMKEIISYMEDTMTASWITRPFGKTENKPRKKETITSEIIYYWMIALNIPSEYETWHLNRLLMLIEIVNIKNAPKDARKIDKREAARQRAALNAVRRAKYNTKG